MNSWHSTGFSFSGLIPQSPPNENSATAGQSDPRTSLLPWDDDRNSDQEHESDLVDISRAGLWTVSSCNAEPIKAADNFLDSDNLETFWLTGLNTGSIPSHWAMVRFPKVVHVSQMDLYLHYGMDSNWCPKVFSVWAGMSVQQLTCILDVTDRFDFSNTPEGWQTLNLTDRNNGAPVPCCVLKILFSENYSNGQNMRLRGLKLLASPEDQVEPVVLPRPTATLSSFSTPPGSEAEPSHGEPAAIAEVSIQWPLDISFPSRGGSQSRRPRLR